VTNFHAPASPWRKSTACESTACVEVAAGSGAVYVRDTVNRAGATIACTPAAWAAFTQSLAVTSHGAAG
jgi:hypothetical protein